MFLLLSGYGNSVSNLPLSLDTNMNGNLAVCYVAYDGWNDAMNATYVLNISELKLFFQNE